MAVESAAETVAKMDGELAGLRGWWVQNWAVLMAGHSDGKSAALMAAALDEHWAVRRGGSRAE